MQKKSKKKFKKKSFFFEDYTEFEINFDQTIDSYAKIDAINDKSVFYYFLIFSVLTFLYI